MIPEVAVIQVPNVLNGITEIERFYAAIQAAPKAHGYVLDMRDVKFVSPYGIISLVNAARYLAASSNQPIRLKNITSDVHLYLDRVDLFDVGDKWLQPMHTLGEEWTRNPQTANLLELTLVTGPNDVAIIASRAYRIFSHWLAITNLNGLLSVVSELCANVYQHSGDSYGCMLIQKYEASLQGQIIVQLAVGDMGCGIRGSLETRYSGIGQQPLDYLLAAMRGLSARSTGRGGLGLRRVEQIVASNRGYFWMRSETAALMTRGPKTVQAHEGLLHIRGTQVAVELRAPL